MDGGDGEVSVPEVDGLPLPSSLLCSSPALLSRKKQSGWLAVTQEEQTGDGGKKMQHCWQRRTRI
jgi:hypothetical protein